MDRRQFIKGSALLAGAAALPMGAAAADSSKKSAEKARFGGGKPSELKADIVIIGGGMGACAAALGACRNGMTVIMTEETSWIGGQASQQGVPPDEHKWIETTGSTATYRAYRNNIRKYYRDWYPLTPEAFANPFLNPGSGGVSRICHEPVVTVQVLTSMLMPYVSRRKLQILLKTKARKADVTGDRVNAVTVENMEDGHLTVLSGSIFIDGTELGDLLPMTGTEYVSGAEAKTETKEYHALEKADPTNTQAITMCFAMDYVPGGDFVIDKPKDYDFWRNYRPKLEPVWGPGKLLHLDYSTPSKPVQTTPGRFNPLRHEEGGFDWWNYRKIINKKNFVQGAYGSDITIVNWPQNDYYKENIVDVSEKQLSERIEEAKQLSLSLFYWLQTEVPRSDGGQGWPGLRLRGDVLGTEDGFAQYPYIREARRIKALFTITEEHIGKQMRRDLHGSDKAASFPDSVGIGYYHLDLHPSCGGNNSIDTDSLPFEIPLGALIPIRTENLLPACKNIGTTHISNGCYRLHPVEWSIGEAVGCLAAYSISHKFPPKAVREASLQDFQSFIEGQGVEIRWNI